MGKGKPLFEILNEQKLEREAQQLNLRRAGKKSAAEKQSQPQLHTPQAVSTPAPAPAAACPEPQPQSAPEPVVEADGKPGAAAGVLRWLKEPVAWRVPRGGVGAGIAAMMAIAATSFFAGQQMGEQTAEAEQQEYNAASSTLVEFQQQPNLELIPPTVTGGVDAQSREVAMGDGRPEGEDPRIENLNYFRLLAVPSSASDEIYRIVDFLRDNGVDAAVLPINNGGSLKVVALPGFERPRSDPRALELKDKLLRLGRKWDTEHDGSTDWRDLFAEKYVRGIN